MSNTRKRRRPQAAAGNGHSLRARLATRQRPTTSYPLLVDDPTEPRARLEQAAQRYRQAVLRYDEPAHDKARQAVADAEQADQPDVDALAAARAELEAWDQKAAAVADALAAGEQAQRDLDGCYATIRLQAMRPQDYEMLIAAHPPEGEQADDAPPWNDTTLVPALLAACAEGDMTEDAWAALLVGDDEGHGLSRKEAWELRTLVVGLNEKARFADPAALPFASTGIRNLRWS